MKGQIIRVSTSEQSREKFFFASISIGTSPEVLAEYLREISRAYEKAQIKITVFLFYNYLKIPFFICKKIFAILTNRKEVMTTEQFCFFFRTVYAGTLNDKINFVFNILDKNFTKKININDVKILYSHFFALSNFNNIDEGFEIINNFFEENQEMTFEEYEKKLETKNSDVFFLIYYFFFQLKPFEKNSLDYYNENICKKNNNKAFNPEDFGVIVSPSGQLLTFLGYEEGNDMEELSNFEKSVSSLITQAGVGEIIKSKSMQTVSLKRCSLKDNFSCFRKQRRKSSIYTAAFVGIDKTRKSSFILEAVEKETLIQNILNEHIFSATCVTKDSEKYIIEIVGNDIYFFEEKKEKEKFKKLLPIKDLSVTVNEKNKKEILITSSLTGVQRKILLYFETEEIAQDVFDIITRKSNFVSICDLYCLDSLIGKGSFGTVLKGKNAETNTDVAVKIIKKTNISCDVELEQIRYEQDISVLFKANPQENIVKVFDVLESLHALYIIQEYVSSGDLNSYFHDKDRNNDQIVKIFLQIANGIAHYTQFGIVHRDLKPSNILIEKSGPQAQIKIIDFGLAKIGYQDELITGIHGTASYIAPETLMNTPYTSKVDVWSFGLIIFYLVYGYNLFEGATSWQITKEILNSPVILPKNDSFKRPVDIKIIELISLCLKKKAFERPKITDLIDFIHRFWGDN